MKDVWFWIVPFGQKLLGSPENTVKINCNFQVSGGWAAALDKRGVNLICQLNRPFILFDWS